MSASLTRKFNSFIDLQSNFNFLHDGSTNWIFRVYVAIGLQLDGTLKKDITCLDHNSNFHYSSNGTKELLFPVYIAIKLIGSLLNPAGDISLGTGSR